MNKPVQARTLKTRAKLIDAAKAVVAESGYEALRVEEVVQRAGVAKGTFFAHFRDKDALMDQLLGAQLREILDDIAAGPQPRTAAEMVTALAPLIAFATSERYVFDVVIRHSGAAAITEIGPIALAFEQQFRLSLQWVTHPDLPVRDDIPPELLAEGIGAFLIQAISLAFCALHSSVSVEERLEPYLRAWLR
ncbi:TetR/AcrR family transcriptional regulator [uncultured Tateyamaria sp.]|uniref:TetR/AcrR family transcriptional regulator n=1 Tax=Tateyamaria sp. 1078 TaxID=3417464 RepID=UPI00262D5115|nr:TetR/AcrR family transcriptional regulator [uncultured Tateyamaria sp.]